MGAQTWGDNVKYAKYKNPAENFGSYLWHINQLKYHASLEWIMPVMDNVRAMGHQVVLIAKSENKNEVKIYMPTGIKPIEVNNTFEQRTLLECLWLSIVQFIQWHQALDKSKGG